MALIKSYTDQFDNVYPNAYFRIDTITVRKESGRFKYEFLLLIYPTQEKRNKDANLFIKKESWEHESETSPTNIYKDMYDKVKLINTDAVDC
ncbi:MAG: hypothetical protein SFH39_00530 [Candidatus Magnetobacterium sp. LHC-1]